MRANLTMNGEARATAGLGAEAGDAYGSRDPRTHEGLSVGVLQEGREAQEGLAT